MTWHNTGPVVTEGLLTRFAEVTGFALPDPVLRLYKTVANGGDPDASIEFPLQGDGLDTSADAHYLMGLGHPDQALDLLRAYENPLEWVHYGIPLSYDSCGNVTLYMLEGERVGQIWHLIMDQFFDEEPLEIYFVAKDMDGFIAILEGRRTDVAK